MDFFSFQKEIQVLIESLDKLIEIANLNLEKLSEINKVCLLIKILVNYLFTFFNTYYDSNNNKYNFQKFFCLTNY